MRFVCSVCNCADKRLKACVANGKYQTPTKHNYFVPLYTFEFAHAIFSRMYVLCLVIFGFFCDKSFNRGFNFISMLLLFRLSQTVFAVSSLFYPWLPIVYSVFFSLLFVLFVLALICAYFNYIKLPGKKSTNKGFVKGNSWFSLFYLAGHEVSMKIGAKSGENTKAIGVRVQVFLRYDRVFDII